MKNDTETAPPTARLDARRQDTCTGCIALASARARVAALSIGRPDLFDDAFGVALEALAGAAASFCYERGNEFTTYAYPVVNHAVFKWARAQRRQPAQFAEDAPEPLRDGRRCRQPSPAEAQEEGSPEDCAVRRGGRPAAEVLAELIGLLPRLDAQAVRARYLSAASRKGVATYAEVAERCGCTVGEARARCERALRSLRALVNGGGDGRAAAAAATATATTATLARSSA